MREFFRVSGAGSLACGLAGRSCRVGGPHQHGWERARRRAAATGCALALLACASSKPEPQERAPQAHRPQATQAAAAQPDERSPQDTEETAAFALLPDTQFYACAYPDIFEQQARFLVDNRATLALGIVLHTGDIVDAGTAAQWSVAARALHRLDGHLPYLLVPGNHDMGADRRTALNDYFSPRDVSTGDVTVQMRREGQLDNAFAIVSLRGQRWLFIGLEFAPRSEVVAWAAEVLRAHPGLPTVLFTHAYLYSDGERYDRRILPQQPYHPDSYQVTPEEGISDGEDLWLALVEPFEQVRLVLSGHVIPDGVARSIAYRASGTPVHQVLTNYQTCASCPCEVVEGGGGYLRIFELAEDRSSLSVTTYSPHLDSSLSDDENWFELAW